METIQSIRSRVKGIASTRQITQSMRLVSTAKVQKARSRMEANRPYAEGAARLVRIAAEGWQGDRHIYLHGHRVPSNTAAVVILSGDRGLCGGYNIGVAREALAWADAHEGETRLVTVGSKAGDYIKRGGRESAKAFLGVSETPLHDDAEEITALLLDWYNTGQVDEVWIARTRFRSMLSQEPVVERLLPLEIDGEPAATAIRLEPEGEEFLEQAVVFYLSASLYGAMLEAACCEQSARISSMDSAVKNADDMMEKLSLSLNQARQGTITNEIIEIVSGASAVHPQGG